MKSARIEKALLEMAERRGSEKTFCPSEVARELAPDDWRPLMTRVRQVAQLLTDAGQLVCTQGGRRVKPTEAQGPIRLGKAAD